MFAPLSSVGYAKESRAPSGVGKSLGDRGGTWEEPHTRPRTEASRRESAEPKPCPPSLITKPEEELTVTSHRFAHPVADQNSHLPADAVARGARAAQRAVASGEEPRGPVRSRHCDRQRFPAPRAHEALGRDEVGTYEVPASERFGT